MRITVALALTAISLGLVKAVTFDSAALKQYNDCGQLSKDECLTWHEAQDKCPTCGGGSSTTQSPGSTTPGKSGKKGGKKGKGGGGKCFYGEDTIMTNYGSMKIKDMVGKSDLQALSRSDDNRVEMSPVISWLHVSAEKSTEFVQLTTESGHELRLTAVHLIYETDCQGNSKTIFASKVALGKCLFVNNDEGALVESKVVAKSNRTLKGIYAPITANGNVVVNNVLASCFTEYENDQVQKIIYSSLNSLRRVLSYVTPSSLVDTLLNTPFNVDNVKIPKLFLGFMDLMHSFVK